MPAEPIDPSQKLVRSQELLEADVNGEIVALHIDKGQCYGMNEVASRVWALLAEPVSLDQICETLTQEYEIDQATCAAEVGELVGELKSEGLVRPA